MTKWSSLLDKVKNKHNWFWFGEIHGIQNNYKVYKEILRNSLFNTLAIEMPEDLEEFSEKSFRKYKAYDDGRFSKQSLEFYNWIKEQGIQLICFDSRKEDDQANGELSMANSLISKVKADEMVLIVSGDFHSQTTTHENIKPMAKIVKEKFNKNFLSITLKYSGGNFYNFGVKELGPGYLSYDKEHLPFGTVTKNKNQDIGAKYWFHCGEAKAVNLLD